MDLTAVLINRMKYMQCNEGSSLQNIVQVSRRSVKYSIGVNLDHRSNCKLELLMGR